MAGIFGVAVRGLGMLGKKLAKKQKTTGRGAIKSVPPSTKNKKFGELKDQSEKMTQKHTKNLTEEGKVGVRKSTSKYLSNVSKILKGKK